MTDKDYWKKIEESKKAYHDKTINLPFMKKVKILIKLQEKAYAMGKTQFKPWKL